MNESKKPPLEIFFLIREHALIRAQNYIIINRFKKKIRRKKK